MNEFLEYLEFLLKDFNTESKELDKYLTEFICNGGKRVRSKLAFLCIKSVQNEVVNEQMQLIAACELLHAASLIHDDIIDSALMRRGMKTLSTMFDSKLAVIAGDFLASVALNKINAIKNQQIQDLFLRTFSQMCTAEISQYFSRGIYPTIDEYLIKTRNKTAELFAVLLKGVALLSDKLCPEEMYNLGLSYGIAFQIKNDLVGFESEGAEDFKNQIFTAPYIFMNNGFSRKDSIEKTKFLMDNEKKNVYSILQNLPDNEFAQSVRKMTEEL